VALAALAALALTAPVTARADFGKRPGDLAASSTTLPIPAWLSFCERYPEECKIDLSEPALVRLDQRTLQLLVTTNKRVNAQITPLSDLDHWGVGDQWDIPTDGAGDCEDYQLLKRKLLAEAGLPRRAMRMAAVNDRGEGHAVLLVHTDRGDFVLDNKVESVLPWDKTGYVFVKRESDEALEWVSLTNEAGPNSTAEIDQNGRASARSTVNAREVAARRHRTAHLRRLFRDKRMTAVTKRTSSLGGAATRG
jgi:predicted transglutaminase-like cysteine proteinase